MHRRSDSWLNALAGRAACRQSTFEILKAFGTKTQYYVMKSDNIIDLVLRVEELYGQIDREFTADSRQDSRIDDEKIEAWSQEIERLCTIIDGLPVTDVEDLKAKVLLNLSLISKSFLDSRSIETHSDKIVEAIDDFNTGKNNPTLRIVG